MPQTNPDARNLDAESAGLAPLPHVAALPQLIALDMDGTLLDAQGNIPPGFDEVYELARERGVTLLPASGRQLATLRGMFPHVNSFLAENGTVVMHEGEIVSTSPLPEDVLGRARNALSTVEADHTIVVCTPETAYVERSAPTAARTQLDKYYRAVTWVNSLDEAPTTGLIKLAFFCESGSEAHLLAPLREAIPEHNIAVSGEMWLDIMAAGAHKGVGLKNLAQALGIDISQTAAFGDFLNDYELLQTAGLAIAMDNAHPKLKEIADYIAPPNTEHGVIQVLRRLLATP